MLNAFDKVFKQNISILFLIFQLLYDMFKLDQILDMYFSKILNEFDSSEIGNSSRKPNQQYLTYNIINIGQFEHLE